MVGFRAGREITDALDAASRAEGEPKSTIMRRAVAEWLKARGYLVD